MALAADPATDLDSTRLMTLTSSVCPAIPGDLSTFSNRMILAGWVADRLISGKMWRRGDGDEQLAGRPRSRWQPCYPAP
jgi:hypothetical protein